MIPSHSFSTSVSLQTEMPNRYWLSKKKSGQIIHIKGKTMLTKTLQVIDIETYYDYTNINITKTQLKDTKNNIDRSSVFTRL